VDELAMVRAAQHDDRFWTAVLRFCATRPGFFGEAAEIAASASSKLRAFLASFDLWRRHAREGALSDCMRRILDETHYESLVLAQERGEERLANVNRLLRLLRQFDPYQRQGLLRFLRFVEAQRDAEAEEEPASSAATDAVRLLSIHQSKGLEFPVVAVADLSKPFNVSDLHADILLDSEFGLCPRITPPNINARYPSLPYWLARQRQKKELLGEELRLLYVAMTRARDHLLLIGGVTMKQFETRWNENSKTSVTALLQARSYADWLAMWFAKNCTAASGTHCGETQHCRWEMHDDTSLIEAAAERTKNDGQTAVKLSKAETERLRQRLSVNYPFAAATAEPAKTSVSALRRRATEFLEQEEAVDFFKSRSGRAKISARKKSATEIGTVYHRFLEAVSLDRANGDKNLRAEAERMVSEGVLSAPEVEWLDFQSLAEFWRSDFGLKILANPQYVRRELAFTARFSPVELGELSPAAETSQAAALQDEFVTVQGVADIAVILPEEIWLLDFKTDDVTGNELTQKTRNYGPQLRLYARALEKIYGKPVTDCRLHFLSTGTTVPLTIPK
jgi:ATP-dependent helicase/nuclease subunit A